MSTTFEKRKQELLVHGAMCRNAIRAHTQNLGGMVSDGPLDAARSFAGTALGMLGSGRALSVVKIAFPLVATALSTLSSRRLLKPALRLAGIAGIVAAGYWLFRKKQKN